MKQYPLYDHEQLSTLRDMVDWCADQYKDQPAFSWQSQKIVNRRSFAQVRKDVRRIGAFLENAKTQNGHIAILGENAYEWIVSNFGITYCGFVSVPLDKDMPLAEVLDKLQYSDSDLLFLSDTYSDYAEPVQAQGVRVILFSEITRLLTASAETPWEEQDAHVPDENSLASIVYTSGTTGKAKGVMLTHGNYTSDVYASSCNVLLESDGFLVLPLHHTYGWTAAVLVAFYYGRNVFINQSIRKIASDLKLAAPQHIFMVPLLVETLYKNIWTTAKKNKKDRVLRIMLYLSTMLRRVGIDLRRKLFKQVLDAFGGNLTLIVSGGAPLSSFYIRAFDQLGVTLLNGYGITECAPVVAVNRNQYSIMDSVGFPLVSNEVKIAPDGEILVRGKNVMLGYYRDEAETQACLKDGWFYTGDLGRIGRDGCVQITGRKKNLLILNNGENVSAEELEANILEHISYIKEVIVSEKENKIVAECYLDPDCPDASERINGDIANLNRKSAPAKRIGEVVIRDQEFPKTTTKKIIRGGK